MVFSCQGHDQSLKAFPTTGRAGDAQKPILSGQNLHPPSSARSEVKMRSTVGLVALIWTISQVVAHGFVPTIRVDGVEYPGWNVNLDAYAIPAVRSLPNMI